MLRVDNRLVSVVIPTYNRFDLACRAVDSVLSQTYTAVEVILVDDSQDRTYDRLIDHFGPRHNVSVIRGDRQGSGPARVKGVNHASGAYIAFLDSDDYWAPTNLERRVSLMQRSDRIGMAWTAWAAVNASGVLRVFRNPVAGDVLPGPVLARQLFPANLIHMSAGMVRRQAYESIGGFPSGITHYEDWALWLLIAERWDVAYADDILTFKWMEGPRKGENALRTTFAREHVRVQLSCLLRRPRLYATVHHLYLLGFHLWFYFQCKRWASSMTVETFR